MEQGLTSYLRQNKWIKLSLIIIGVLLIVWIGYLIVVGLTPRVKYQLTPLNTSTSTVFTDLRNDTLYSYNGSAFLATDITSADPPQVLHSGLKLPIIRNIEWAGDKGALVQFEAGFTYTEVERYLENNNISLFSDYSNFMWYIDFSDGSLSLVWRDPLLSDQIHYSEAANGFYFVLNIDIDSPDNLAFYSIDDKKISMVESMPQLDVVSHINGCFDNKSVCVTAIESKESADPTIYRINPDNQKSSSLISSTGNIMPTSHQDIYIIRDSLKGSKDTNQDQNVYNQTTDHEDIDTDLTQGKLYNLATKQFIGDVNIDTEGNNVATLISDSGQDIAHLSLDQGMSYTSSVRTLFGTVSTRDQTLVSDEDIDMLIPLYYGGLNQLITTDTESNLYIISTAGLVKHEFKTIEASDIESMLEGCQSAGITDFKISADTKEVNVFLPDDGNFLQYVKNAANCTAKNPDIQMSYRFIYKGINPETGRITIT